MEKIQSDIERDVINFVASIPDYVIDNFYARVRGNSLVFVIDANNAVFLEDCVSSSNAYIYLEIKLDPKRLIDGPLRDNSAAVEAVRFTLSDNSDYSCFDLNDNGLIDCGFITENPTFNKLISQSGGKTDLSSGGYLSYNGDSRWLEIEVKGQTAQVLALILDTQQSVYDFYNSEFTSEELIAILLHRYKRKNA